MIINSISTQKIPNTLAFKGMTPMFNVANEAGSSMHAFSDSQIDSMLQKAQENPDGFRTLLRRSQEDINTVVVEYVNRNNLGKTVEVVKEVPASGAKAATTAATQIPWKKYGPIAAIAAVAVGATAFFIGKAAERKRQDKLNGESDPIPSNKQPQPVLQEIAKKTDSIENFFSAPQATAKT